MLFLQDVYFLFERHEISTIGSQVALKQIKTGCITLLPVSITVLAR